MENKLIIFDVGGVIRDSSKAIEEGYRRGFAKFGVPYGIKTLDSWHLRGLSR